MPKGLTGLLLFVLFFLSAEGVGMPKRLARWTGADDLRLVWDVPPTEDWQFLAMGNGHLGITAFLPDELVVQVNATDNWNEEGDLPGICRWHIDFGGKPFQTLRPFAAWMDLRRGELVFHAGGSEGISVVLRVQRDADVVIADLSDRRPQPQPVTVWLETWRGEWQPIPLPNSSVACLVERNESSQFKDLCATQLMAHWAEQHPDPWLHWGTAVCLATAGAVAQQTANNTARWHFPSARHRRLMLAVFIGRGTKEELANYAWAVLRTAQQRGDAVLDVAHQQGWQQFWQNTFLRIESNDPEWQALEATWHLWRFYLAGCTSDRMVGKFNGGNYLYNRDLRSWGGPFWWQNMRLMFWGCLKTGDDELLRAFFRLYTNALPFQQERIRKWFGHGGAIFPETMHFFGAFRMDDVIPRGWEVRLPYTFNPYIRWHYTGSLELLWMMLHFYEHTRDDAFADTTLRPLAEAVLQFFLEHFPRDPSGKLRLEPAQSLETWWDAVNPADQVAGLQAVVPAMVQMAKARGWDPRLLQQWQQLHAILPPLPRGRIRLQNGRFVGMEPTQELLAPFAELKDPQKHNFEDPELYAVFPFDLFGLDRPELPVAINTFRARLHPQPHWGWSQTAIWAARLGLTEEAVALIKEHRRHGQRFPSGLCWSPGRHHPQHPDLPDAPYLDTLGAIAIALQEMLLQETPAGLRVLPAWDLSVPVHFRLRTAAGGWVEVQHHPAKGTSVHTERPVPYHLKGH